MIEAREAESESDADLLSRYQRLDDIAAYTELDRRYRADLVKQARRNLHRMLREDAEDVVQKALLKFHLNRATYAPQDVRALLQTLVCSACKDHARRTRAAKRDCRKTFPLDDGQSENGLEGNRAGNFSDPKADPHKQETRIDLEAALAVLTPQQAEAVRLDMEGHNHESAAAVTGISPEGQRRRLYSARRRIKEFLTPTVVLLALIGSLSDNCDANVYFDVITAEIAEDEFRRSDSVSRGLFGRRRCGTFWIPGHTRGLLEHGRAIPTCNAKSPARIALIFCRHWTTGRVSTRMLGNTTPC